MKKIVSYILIAVALLGFFSFRLTQVPKGITVDEAAFGYNGVLLSRTLHDENGRFLPLFVLSIHGADWRQPVTQYFTAIMFKVFGASLLNLRLTAVIFTVISIFLLFFLGKKLLSGIGGTIAAIFLATTPIIMIQSHMGLDNIDPVPFIIVWLLGLLLWSKSKKNFWLIISGISMGIGYYSYKGVRVFEPVWIILTFIYLAEPFLKKLNRKNFAEIIKPVLTFGLSVLPFFIIIPYLEFLYSGAVLGGQHPAFEGIYKLLYPYLSMFDPSFLYIKGDDLLIHSTGTHGMYLLATLPFFIFGLIHSWKKGSFWKLMIASFFLGPLLFGLFGSVHRASRMLAEVPIYSLISAVGFLTLWQKKTKVLLAVFLVLFAFNYYDFMHYYLGRYAEDTQNLFYCFTCVEPQFKTLKAESIKKDLVPYLDEVVAKRLDTAGDFARSIYFTVPPKTWDGKKEDLPKDAILMTDNDKVGFLNLVDHVGNLYYYTY